ncbi:sugar ABC transporter substrate-binding protein [Pseudoflavonifractor phocaeensis]|uniref:substrate-binding domain-containing protein n=1 Tax=Pseudoflavonifractor phocaeensis TaxID=1870988 RepID=UPI0025A36D35|nr:sugar-binding protein [Pseudoflavonifractor phocaeensis]MDM8238702.1 sugar ABC transporter substrate-binding protein [Pseudoflavonifractor phocaeensis]
MKKRILALALSAAMALSLAACSNGGDASGSGSGSGSGSSSGGSTGAQKVGIAMPTQSLERWNRDGSYLDEQFKSAGYETILTYSDNDINRQVNDIQNMIAEDVDLLVIAAIDGEALNTVMNEAGQAGIPVIAYDRLIMNDNASYYVSFDNYTVGTLQGQYIVDTLDLDNAAGPFNMEITAGDPADNNATYFYQGAVDVLQPYIDSGKLVVVSGQTDFDTVATAQWDSQTAMERAQNVLASYYADGTQVDVWLCSNDSTALGVSQAIQSDYAGSNQPIITGQDGDEANLKNLVDGLQSMTVYKAVANEAVVTLDLGKAILSGAAIDANLITDSGWEFDCSYDTESYNTSDGHNCPSFLLIPDVVTKDNMVEKLVDTGYYTQDADGYLHPAA